MLFKHGSTSRDWLSFRMKDFVPEIEKLSQMDEGLTHALKLIILAGKHSFTAIPGIGPLYNGGRCPRKKMQKEA